MKTKTKYKRNKSICFLLLMILIFAGHKTIAQKKSKQNKFYSAKNDLKFEAELINDQRIKILKSNTQGELLLKLRSVDNEIRISVIQSLGYITDDFGRNEIENLLLNDSSSEIRLACVHALNVIRSYKSINTLKRALNDNDEQVRIWAAIDLSIIGEKIESLKFFSKYYDEKKEIPFYACHLGFLYIGSPEVQKYLSMDLSNPDPFISVDAAIKLSQIGFGNSALFKQSLSNSDKYIRMAALRGLAYIGDENSLQIIKSMQNDTNPLVKERAESIVKQIEQ